MTIIPHSISKMSLIWMTITLVILGGLIGGILPRLLPASYEVSLTLDIQQQRDISDEYYSYDGFYAIQAEELMSDNVARWFISPGFVQQVIQISEPELLGELSLRDFRNLFQAEQLSAALVEVQFGVEDPELGQKRAKAIDQALQERIIEQDLQGYIIQSSEAVIRPRSYVLPFWIVGGAVLGGGLALSLILLKETQKPL